MISSGKPGSLYSIYGHYNEVYCSESYVARGCRKKIKVCGSIIHSVMHIDSSVEDWASWVVCRPCLDYRRQAKHVDYSSYPIITKNIDSYLIIVEEGIVDY